MPPACRLHAEIALLWKRDLPCHPFALLAASFTRANGITGGGKGAEKVRATVSSPPVADASGRTKAVSASARGASERVADLRRSPEPSLTSLASGERIP